MEFGCCALEVSYQLHSEYHSLPIPAHHPNATLIKTKGLGHRRILRDENVMQHIKSFIQTS